MKVPWRVIPLLFALSLRTLTHGQLVISEFMADNKKTLADENAEYSDWIEIYNAGTTGVNLAGWSLTDDPTRQSVWKFPSTNLAANGYLVIFASGTNKTVLGQPLHADFKLSSAGEYLGLLKPDGTVASEFGASYPQQYSDISYGIAQNVTTNTLVGTGAPGRFLVPTSGTLGTGWSAPAFSDSTWASAVTGVGYETAVPGFAVKNIKANIGVGSLDTALGLINTPAQQSAVYTENAATINYFNTGSSANYANDRTFPGFTSGVDMDDFVVEATATVTIPAAGNWTFGVNSDDGFSLFSGEFHHVLPGPARAGGYAADVQLPSRRGISLAARFLRAGWGIGGRTVCRTRQLWRLGSKQLPIGR